MKILVKIIITLLILIGICSFVLGYFGLIPGISRIFGSDKPRDLGVTFTQEDFNSGRAKTGKNHITLSSDLPPKESLKYSGSRALNTSFTYQELTALVYNRPWKYYPVKDVKIKISDDGVVESSGILIVDRIIPCLQAFGVESQEAENIINRLNFLKGNPAFYVKGKGSITNNIVDIDLISLEIGRISIPLNLIGENERKIDSFLEERLKTVTGLSIKSLTLKNGKLFFNGTFPTTEYYSP